MVLYWILGGSSDHLFIEIFGVYSKITIRTNLEATYFDQETLCIMPMCPIELRAISRYFKESQGYHRLSIMILMIKGLLKRESELGADGALLTTEMRITLFIKCKS